MKFIISILISFYTFSKNQEFITFENFKNLELFGTNLKLCENLTKRIFGAIDDNNSSKITFEEYIKFIYILSYGSIEEKCNISFKMIDLEKNGVIKELDLNKYFIDILEYKKIFSTNINEYYLENLKNYTNYLYNKIDLENKGYFNYEDYKIKYFENPEYLTLFLNLDDMRINIKNIEDSQNKLGDFKNSLTLIKFELNKLNNTFKPLDTFTFKKDNFVKYEKNIFINNSFKNVNNFNNDILISENINSIKKLPNKNYFSNNNINKNNNNFDFKTNKIYESKINCDFEIIIPKLINPVELPKESNFLIEQKDFENNLNFKNNINNLINYTNNLLNRVNNELNQSKLEIQNSIIEKQIKTKDNIPKIKEHQKNSVVFLLNKNWILISFMMIGIQRSINSCVNFYDKIRKIDFKSKNQYDLSASNFSNDKKKSFKKCYFFDYANNVFNSIRDMFNIKNKDFIQSIGNDILIKNLLQGNLKSFTEMISSGKSGSFFYYSFDGKYILKTIRKDEFKFLKKILPNYYNHISKYKNTLLPLYFGLYKIIFSKLGTHKKNEKIYFIIMKNTFDKNYIINLRYDLKGSTYKRETFSNNNSIAMKDLNFIKNKKEIIVDKNLIENLNKQVALDVEFFEENHIIDYSLLLGIHIMNEDIIDIKENIINEFMSIDNKELYLISFIDILTSYNTLKKIEYGSKLIIFGKGISCSPPNIYAKRFLNFFKKIWKTSN